MPENFNSKYIHCTLGLLKPYTQNPTSLNPIKNTIKLFESLTQSITAKEEIIIFYTALLTARHCARQCNATLNVQIINALIEKYSCAHTSLCHATNTAFNHYIEEPLIDEGYSH